MKNFTHTNKGGVMKKNFANEYERLSYLFFKASGGNPYLIQELVNERNQERAKEEGRSL